MPAIELVDSFMNYRDTGAGDVPVVFLYGNPHVVLHPARRDRARRPAGTAVSPRPARIG